MQETRQAFQRGKLEDASLVASHYPDTTQANRLNRSAIGYRADIDGLRAFAVFAVCFFHAGLLPNGYLGVDVFFAISGFLITSIIIKEIDAGEFSLIRFYERRVRRILPLAIFATVVVLAIGYFVMLPDDLENLAQSVVATNLMANNLFLSITTRDYWAPANEFKPLMHTWSLAIEEQFYMVYPFALSRVARIARRHLVLLILMASAVSFLPNLWLSQTFYFAQYRFWELALGGALAIRLAKSATSGTVRFLSPPMLVGMMVVLFWPSDFGNALALKTITVLLTLGLLAAGNRNSKVSDGILSNPVIVYLGKISFSIYIWHQILFAFGRYVFWGELSPVQSTALIGLAILVSVGTYHFLEQPFRDRRKIGAKTLIACVLLAWATTMAAALSIHWKAGVVRDVPELDIKVADATRGLHAAYNDSVNQWDRPFSGGNRLKVLVIGDSHARDWVNVLLESRFATDLDVSYLFAYDHGDQASKRAAEADLVFLASLEAMGAMLDNAQRLDSAIDLSKTWIVGTKNFGVSNGVFYNYRGHNYFSQRATVQTRRIAINRADKNRWPDRYLDILSKLMDGNQTVPVFSDENKFISQDGDHLTKAGARYIGKLLDSELETCLRK